MSVLVAAPILLSLTLLASGLAKLGARQGTEDAMTSLRLPLRSLHRVAATVLPAAEIALALALWVPVVAVQVVVAVLVALLMLSYLVIIGRALTWDEAVECSCFGTLASPTVSRATLGRNLVLTALAVLGVAAAATGRISQALLEEPLMLAGWALALVVAVVLTVLALGGLTRNAAPVQTATGATAGTPAAGASSASGSGLSADSSTTGTEGEELDYERASIPGAVVQQPGGRLITLSQLTAQQAALLLFVSEGCGPCERVLDRMQGWVETLSPYMQVRAVFPRPLDQLRERTTQRVGAHALHDLQFTARTALGASGAPAAVLLGADGLLAGGPVTGGSDVIDFVEEIEEQLQIAQQEGELPLPQS